MSECVTDGVINALVKRLDLESCKCSCRSMFVCRDEINLGFFVRSSFLNVHNIPLYWSYG